uniref:Reprolysin n=1 Tax=Rhipicephalus appendiculatus TaxID=34631 RepID=A0A131YUU8_RHIAP
MNRGTHGFITATAPIKMQPLWLSIEPHTGAHQSYTLTTQVSLRYQQLGSRCSIVITSIIGSRIENEYYVHRRNANEIYGKETLEKLAAVLKRNQATVRADVAFLLTGRNVVQWNGKTITANHVGLAFVGQACAYFKTGLGMDDPLTFSGLHTTAHELGHLLNSTHDGEGGSAKCRADHEHLMHAYEGGQRNYLFSSCSVNAINEFLRSESSFCLKESATFLKYYLPDGVLKKEGPYLTGPKYCKLFFPNYKNASYVGRQNSLSDRCHFRCRLMKSWGTPKEVDIFAPHGTPCTNTGEKMTCYYGLCGLKRG